MVTLSSSHVCAWCGRHVSKLLDLCECPHCDGLLWIAEYGQPSLPAKYGPDCAVSPPQVQVPSTWDIPEDVVKVLPASVAFENSVVPAANTGDVLLVVSTYPVNLASMEKLRFILNRMVAVVATFDDWIAVMRDRHYGPLGGRPWAT